VDFDLANGIKYYSISNYFKLDTELYTGTLISFYLRVKVLPQSFVR
jgi:hypothetical protein